MIALTVARLALLGEHPFVTSIRSAFREGPTRRNTSGLLLSAVGLVLLIAIALRYFSGDRRARRAPRVDHLARALRTLEIGDQERRDLRQLAGRAKLTQPLSCLLSPANLDRALDSAQLAPDDALRARIESIRPRLFESE